MGELVGFIPPAIAGALLITLDAPEIFLVIGLVVAGLGEGLTLGLAQSTVLRDALPNVSGWVVATTLAAGAAWLAGMGGSALVQAVGPLALLVAGPGWILGLASMGYLQWRRLRHSVDGAARWIPVTTLAWLVGVAIPVVALSVVPTEWPIGAHVVVGVAAAVAMGATVGALTGSTLAQFARRARAVHATSDRVGVVA